MKKRLQIIITFSLCMLFSTSFGQKAEDVGAGVIDFLLSNPKTANKMNSTEASALNVLGNFLKTKSARDHELEVAKAGRNQYIENNYYKEESSKSVNEPTPTSTQIILNNKSSGQTATLVNDVNGNIYLLYNGTIYPISSELIELAINRYINDENVSKGAYSNKIGKEYYDKGIAAYKGKDYQYAAELFGSAAQENYEMENSIYYKAFSLRQLNRNTEYKNTLIEGYSRFPSNTKISSALANVYVLEGNNLYKEGAEILSSANNKVNKRLIDVQNIEYRQEVERSKNKFYSALELLKKAKSIDPYNTNATKLIEACEAILK
jgi:tetratricopeptide (TPR) repeat protein